MIDEYKKFGLIVINDVFTDQECDIWMDNIINDFVKLETGIDKKKIKETWIDTNLPPVVKAGLFQCLMSNTKDIWDIRSHHNIEFIFKELYSALRNKRIDEFIVSGDGINIKSNEEPLQTNYSRDWAHFDQTFRNDIFKCVQGQAVLTNTTASLVATPKSHLLFEEILDTLKIDKNCTSNWVKFKPNQIDLVKNIIIKSGADWQIPILSKKGSFILWSSTLIHSARLQTIIELPSINDKYLGWRGVVYVCYRPKSEFSKKEIDKRISAYKNNRVTNHWGIKIFPKNTGGRFNSINTKYHSTIQSMIKNPLLVYNKIGMPQLNHKQQKLIGL